MGLVNKIKFFQDDNRNTFGYLKPNSTQVLAMTGASVTTPTALNEGIIRIVCTVVANIEFNGTATANSMLLPANTPEYFSVSDLDTISAIAASGNVFVTQMR